MWSQLVLAVFGLFGVGLIGLSVSTARSLPERGRPESMSLYMQHVFMCCMFFLVGAAFLGMAIAALFGGFSIEVAAWQQFAAAGLCGLGVIGVNRVWKRLRKRYWR
ncbi:hypothetical protein [Actinomadura sp. B10D3]|uniref:hypothetical protein n=1 Tax=Actinomadura sp. B10D3 TaxID=3153557 RepID=UPI00325DED25